MNLKADILTIKKEIETLNFNHHFLISSAVKTAKINESDLLRTEMKKITTLKVSPLGVFSASYHVFFIH